MALHQIALGQTARSVYLQLLISWGFARMRFDYGLLLVELVSGKERVAGLLPEEKLVNHG